MAVSKSKKTDILENLKQNLQNAKSVSFTTNSGLTVAEITDLRVKLREVNTTFSLVKKTLLKIAFKEVYGIELQDSMLEGQIAVICSNDDAISGLGKVNEFIKSFSKDPKITWAGSYIEGELKDAEATKVIASIPSKEVLLSRLVGSMKSPISALARFFNAAAEKLTNEGIENLAGVKAPKKEEPKKDEVKEEKVEEKTKETKVEEIKAPEVEETPVEEVSKEENAGEQQVEEEKKAE